MYKLLLYSQILLTVFPPFSLCANRFYVIREWHYANFTWPDENSLKLALAEGSYVPENNVIGGVQYYEDYYYVSLPRMKRGVPATLARIKAGLTENTAPNFEPFPSWEMNDFSDCNNLQSVNMAIDPKGRMWIIDVGKVETLVKMTPKCSPKLLIFDIKRNMTTTVYNFPEEVAPKDSSYLYDLVVDDTNGGFAYITDNSLSDPGIIVYSMRENRAWKLRHASMRAPSSDQFRVNQISMNGPINIAGIALGPKIRASNDRLILNEVREVYFSPLSGLNLYSINTSTLQNENLSKTHEISEDLVKDLGAKPSQTAGMVMDNRGVLYYGLLGNNAIARWDSQTPFASGQKLIARDDKYIEWPNSFTFDLSGNLTVVMNRLNRFTNEYFDRNEVNFRLISSYIGTKSYLYDNDFNYNSENQGRMLGDLSPSQPEPEPSPEPSSSTISNEPSPKPEPSSKSYSNNPEPSPEPTTSNIPSPEPEPSSKSYSNNPEPTAKPEPGSHSGPQDDHHHDLRTSPPVQSQHSTGSTAIINHFVCITAFSSLFLLF